MPAPVAEIITLAYLPPRLVYRTYMTLSNKHGNNLERAVLLCLMLIANSSQVWSSNTFVVRNINLYAKVYTPVLAWDGTPLADTNYLAELWGGRTPSSLQPGRAIGGGRLFAPFTAKLAGVFLGYPEVDVVGTAGDTVACLQIRVWDSRLGATYEEAAARGLGGVGESPLFYAVGGSDVPNGTLPPTLETLMPSFRVRPMTAVLISSVRREKDQIVIECHRGFTRYQVQWTSAFGMPWNDLGPPTTDLSVTTPITPDTRFFRVIGMFD